MLTQKCGALLGRGGFGVVGLWHKYGKHAEVLDVSFLRMLTMNLPNSPPVCRGQTNRCATLGGRQKRPGYRPLGSGSDEWARGKRLQECHRSS